MHEISSREMVKGTVLASALIARSNESIIFCLLFVLKASHYPILEQLNTADID